MKKLSSSLMLGLIAAAGLFSAHPAQAQIQSPPRSQAPVNRDTNVYEPSQSGDRSSGSFSSENNNMSNIFDLMRRAQIGNIRSGSEFGRAQQEQIGDAASDFRRQQQELLRQQQGNPQAAPQSVPSAPQQ